MRIRILYQTSWVACALLSGGCVDSDPDSAESVVAVPSDTSRVEPPTSRNLQPVVLPDFSVMAESVREQMHVQLALLRSAIEDGSQSFAALGRAYGDMGNLFLAASFFEAAGTCYGNAQTLLPDDRRWPYYLGHVYRNTGPIDAAETAFERALELAPNDVATLVWLGDIYLDQGLVEAAESLFSQALAIRPTSAAARFGAGRVALANGDSTQAVQEFEAALAFRPQASTIHVPLAMAYRNLGDLERAETHLKQRGDVEVAPRDPLMQEVGSLLESAEAYNVRGGQALDVENWTDAAVWFRRGLELAPTDPSLHHRLGTALYQLADETGAEAAFEEAIRADPGHVGARYSMGVLRAAAGRHQEAIEHFLTALEHDPVNIQARAQLAGVLGRSGRPGEALAEYERVLDMDPTHQDAAFGYSMTLVRLERYEEARTRLSADSERYPDHPLFTHALARLLSAAPDDQVRDARLAQQLIERLLEQQQTIELGETTAMMLAELGEYGQAAAVQRDVLAAAQQAGLAGGVVARLEVNLARYERGEPCRTPWTPEELP
jgi:tetratricopeptide (TPR) repeat protein